MILGVPFLRNVYTVMAYAAPDENGSFVPVNDSNKIIIPRLGLLSRGGNLSVGIVVLIGILSFFGLCCALFVARWFIIRRTYRKTILSASHGDDDFQAEKSSTMSEQFMLTKTISKDEKGSKSDFGGRGTCGKCAG